MTPGSLRANLVEGIPEMAKAIAMLKDEELGKVITKTLRAIGTPTRDALVQHYNAAPAKHDGESTKKALQHRWWRNGKGKPVGFSRVQILRDLLKSGFGLKVGKAKTRGQPFFLRVKVRSNAIHLLESGRKKSQTIQRTKGKKQKYTTSNQYRGWMRGIEILKSFAARAAGQLNSDLPGQIELAAARAAKRAGVKP